MKRRWARWLLVLLGVPWAGCSRDGTGLDEFTLADLAGSWDMASFQVTAHSDPQLSIDLIEGGSAIFVSIQPTGDFQGSGVFPGHLVAIPEVEVISVPIVGFVQLTGPGRLRIDYIPELPPIFTTWQPDFELVADTLFLVDPGMVFDFHDEDGGWDPSIFQARLVRR